jgi:cell division protein FtsI (penicillin-binding protein 3)
MNSFGDNFIEKKAKNILYMIAALFLFFVLKDIYIAAKDIKMPSKTKELKDRAVRGDIISSDGYTISRSIKNYSVSIHTRYLDPKKKQFFLNLFSIYTNIPVKELESKFYTKDGKKKRGWIVLSDNIDAKTVTFLKDLKHKLNRLKVFRASGVNKNFYYGLTISEIGESREYPLKETMSPILGYTREKSDGKYKYIVGYNGIEKFYDKYLNNKTDGFVSGRRDAIGYIIYDKNTKYKDRKDGYNVVLNISLALQKNLDVILDRYKQELDAQEVIAAVMETNSSRILAITSSNRYDPLNIKPDEIENLQPKATTYLYEPGSVLKPITYALALDKGIITTQSRFPTYNGKLWIDGFRITDDEPFSSLSAQEIIIHSSNIGISQIAWKLGRKDFRDGLMRFGLGKQKSGIDIGREALGRVYSYKELRSKSNFATNSYGYGMHVTFAQLLKAYNVFNNGGYSITPRTVNYLQQKGSDKKYFVKRGFKSIRPISQESAELVKDTLIEVVKRGTGKAARMEGLEIGGKTGTAMIYENGGYQKEYHTSFFGFANDNKGNKYTIGVLVIRPKYERHFASQSAVPVFKEIINALVDKKMLKPDLTRQQEQEKLREQMQREQKLKEQQLQRTQEIKQKLKEQREKIIKEYKEKKRKKKSKPKVNRVNPNVAPPSNLDLF